MTIFQAFYFLEEPRVSITCVSMQPLCNLIINVDINILQIFLQHAQQETTRNETTNEKEKFYLNLFFCRWETYNSYASKQSSSMHDITLIKSIIFNMPTVIEAFNSDAGLVSGSEAQFLNFWGNQLFVSKSCREQNYCQKR